MKIHQLSASISNSPTRVLLLIFVIYSDEYFSSKTLPPN